MENALLKSESTADTMAVGLKNHWVFGNVSDSQSTVFLTKNRSI